MEDKLQELTQRIYQEGVERAQFDARDILSRAEASAESLLQAARSESERLLEVAKTQAKDLQAKTLADIKIAADQLLATLRQETAEILSGAAFPKSLKTTLSEADFLSSLIKELLLAWAKNPQLSQSLILDLPAALQKELEKQFYIRLKEQLDQGLVLNFDRKLSSGFKIGPADGGWRVSFTEQDFSQLLATYLKQKTRDVLFPGQ